MSTYLSGNPTYLPQIQPFKPNLNLYQGVLQMSQQRYDTNYKKLNSIYGSLLNAQLSRTDTAGMRDEYFKNIEGELKKLANVDLSLSHNADQAEKLFDGLTENKLFVKDVSFTKQYQSQLSRAEALRTMTDPEKGGGQYWETGIRDMQYKVEEFSKADAETAMGMSGPKYVSNVDVMGKAMKIAKDLNLNVKMDRQSGMYIITEKNGEQAAPILQSIFQQRLGDDPAIQEYYDVKSRVNRKDFVRANVEQYGSEEEATKAYIRQAGEAVNAKMSKTKKELSERNALLEERLNFEKDYHDTEIEMGPGTRDKYYRDLEALQQNKKTEETITNIIETNNNSSKLDQLNAIASNIDGSYAKLLMYEDFEQAAYTLAMADHEVTIKGDDVAMMYQKHAWDVEAAELAHKRAMERDAAKIKSSASNGNVLSTGGNDDPNVRIDRINNSEKDLEKGSQDSATFNALRNVEVEASSQLKNNRSVNIDAMMKEVQKEGSGFSKNRYRINKEMGYAYAKQLEKNGDIKGAKEVRRFTDKNAGNSENLVYAQYGNKLDYESVKHIHDKVLVEQTGWFFQKRNPDLHQKVSNVKFLAEELNKFKEVKKEVMIASQDAFFKKLDDKQREVLLKHKDVLFNSMGAIKDLNVVAIDATIKDQLSDYRLKQNINSYYIKNGLMIKTSDNRQFFVPNGAGNNSIMMKKAIQHQRDIMLNSNVKINGKNYKVKDVLDEKTGLLKSKYRNKDVKFSDHRFWNNIKNNKIELGEAFDTDLFVKGKDEVLDFSQMNMGAGAPTSSNRGKSANVHVSKSNNTKSLELNALLANSMDEGVKKIQSISRDKYNVISDLIGLGSEEMEQISFTLKDNHRNPTSQGYEYFQGVHDYLKDFEKGKNDDSTFMKLTSSSGESVGLKNDANAKMIYRSLLEAQKLDQLSMKYINDYNGDKSKQVLRIKIPDNIRKLYAESGEDKTALPAESYLDLVIPDKYATNAFHKTTKVDISQTMFDLKSSIQSNPTYNDFIEARATKKGDQYELQYKVKAFDANGNVAKGVDGEDKYIYEFEYLDLDRYTASDVKKILDERSREYYQDTQYIKSMR